MTHNNVLSWNKDLPKHMADFTNHADSLADNITLTKSHIMEKLKQVQGILTLYIMEKLKQVFQFLMSFWSESSEFISVFPLLISVFPLSCPL